jgi:hypothetical protein
VLRIFGPKRDEIIGGWRKLYNEELRNLYSSSNTIRMIKSSQGNVALMGEKWIFVEKPKGKSPQGRPRRRSEDNTKIDFRELGWGGMD